MRETIVTTALLRLDRSVPRAAKVARAEVVIAEVDLRKCAHSQIGNDLTGGISGGACAAAWLADTRHAARLTCAAVV